MKTNKKLMIFLFSAMFILILLCLCGFYFVKFQREEMKEDEKQIIETDVTEESSDPFQSFEALDEENSEPLLPIEFTDEESEEMMEADRQTDTNASENKVEISVDDIIHAMTIEEKVAQLFVILPEAITDVDVVVAAGDATKNAIFQYPIGGFVYMRPNLTSEEQVKTMLANAQSYSRERIGLPLFLCVDEEGGTVTRIGNTGRFDVPVFEKMSEIGKRGDMEEVFNTGHSIGQYLKELGFNVDFAPVADVITNPENQVVKSRSFGTDPQLVSQMALAYANGLNEAGVCNTYKHFPGHGATEGDTHEGYAFTSKTLEELREKELIPFQTGIENYVDFIMVGHISLPNVTGDDTPASMSKVIITDILRKEMGYEGIVITDALNMGAISQNYSSANAAKTAILAGADILLMPADFYSAYNGVVKAVQDGEISEMRIDESLRRIIGQKILFDK